ncbi:C2H2 type zinc-finger (2 copies) [Novymonas esmeraldas]|uniref:C2H2 type zinc-finger (2 copies) n=1 Tax=Novymonas esmeraldas TaxID=1808958 RepID=A0AAW0F5Y2_9TRYP
MAEDLKASCKQILQRLQQQNVEEFGCVLCGQHVRGQDALMQHLITEHEVHCIHFDNVADLSGLLRHLSARLRSSATSPTHWVCPVCEVDTGSDSIDDLVAHMRATGHREWNPLTIPSMGRWCITGDASVQVAAVSAEELNDVDEDDEDDAAWNAMEDDEVDEDEDWNLECVCLYCNYCGEDVLQHLKTRHDFDFRAAMQERPDVKDEYDLIRVVNMVRRAVCSDSCPYGDSCAVNGRENDRDALEAHLTEQKDHRLPLCVSRGDNDLIPVLPGDAFISMLVTSGEGFLRGEQEDPDFPMVPTVQELAAAARTSARAL